MSTKTDQARESARRLSKAAASTPSQPEPAAPLEPTPMDRVKPIRTTIDLAPALYSEFEDWTIQAGRRIGSKVTQVGALRVLIRRLVEDPVLADEVMRVLRENARR